MISARELFRRMKLTLGFRLQCERCGEAVRIPTRKFGAVLVISGPEVEGWSFTTERGWACSSCSQEEGA